MDIVNLVFYQHFPTIGSTILSGQHFRKIGKITSKQAKINKSINLKTILTFTENQQVKN